MKCSGWTARDSTIITFNDLVFNGTYIESSIGSLFASKNNRVISFENIYFVNFDSQNALIKIMDDSNNVSDFHQTSVLHLHEVCNRILFFLSFFFCFPFVWIISYYYCFPNVVCICATDNLPKCSKSNETTH